MQGADRVNGEFEVGFDQNFERKWYYAELTGRAVMVAFVACALAGFLGRGPFSHQRAYASDGALSVDYEPVARHGTATMVTIHAANTTNMPRLLTVSLDQSLIEPMGLQNTIPAANSSTVSDGGVSLDFVLQPNQPDALIRLNLEPTALGLVRLAASDGTRQVAWSAFVVP